MTAVAASPTVTSGAGKRQVNAAAQASIEFMDTILDGYPNRDFALRFWDGSFIDADAGQPVRFTLVFNHPGAVRQAFWPKNKSAFGEAYIYGDVEVLGDANALLQTLNQLPYKPLGVLEKMKLYEQLYKMPDEARPRPGKKKAELKGDEHSKDRDKQAIEHHYDGPPSEFYALFLGKYMQYTCNYFATPEDPLDVASERKLEHICRKLRLKPGERFIDFGCGWGGLIMYAAKHYGVEAIGVSISKEQIKWTEREIVKQGLQDRCRILYSDYRDAPEDKPYDKAVSVGFIEHLGEKMMPTFFGKVHKLLKPDGQYLHHGITHAPGAPAPPWTDFALKYVFPDGELVPITNTLSQLAQAGFEIRDVEAMREHYALTLHRWLSGLEANREEAIRLTDEVRYRIYRIYFAGAIEGFRTHTYNLNQVLVIKNSAKPTPLPLTRQDWYRPWSPSGK
jgi:cyclopropane-fatty-acyl-phospholipid synthase